MDATVLATLSGAVGLALGAGGVLAARRSEQEQGRAPEMTAAATELPDGVADVLAVLRSAGVVVDSSELVVNNSPSAVANGLVRNNELTHPELRELARATRRDGVIREADLELGRGYGGGTVHVRVRVAPIGTAHVLLLIEDQTHAHRVEEVRRDFVANVSHELKTPVGGLALLAEAVLEGRDDPEAVRRFATKMLKESERLTRLVKEIVDLSRLQAVEAFDELELVDVRRCIQEAVEHTRLAADLKGVTVLSRVDGDLFIYGNEDLMVTAVRNLLANAVTYSEAGTRATVAAALVEDGKTVEISVTDQGRGIPEADLPRIFERFYRVDAARSRATGGTGLGLAIVKHICENFGGAATVWSQEGRGSTFTMRLPAADAPTTPHDVAAPVATDPGEDA